MISHVGFVCFCYNILYWFYANGENIRKDVDILQLQAKFQTVMVRKA